MLFVENSLCFHLVQERKTRKKPHKTIALSCPQDYTALAKRQREATEFIQFLRSQDL